MDGEQKAWVLGFVLVVFLIVSAILIGRYSGQRAMVAMVEAGHSPIAASCAIRSAGNHEILCLEAME